MKEYKEMKNVCMDEAPVRVEERVNMTDLMKSTVAEAEDVLITVGRIHDHLFGADPAENCEKEGTPRCFNEDLKRTNRALSRARNELYKICALLGVE